MRMRLVIVLCAAVCGLAASAPAALAGDTLLGSQTLAAGQTLTSSDGHYQLAMQADGNLVFSVLSGTSSQRALWSSGTHGDTGDHALLQRNGALVLLDPSGQTLWSTNTSAAGCTNLVVQNDGNLVLYPSSGKAVWATGNRPTALIGGDRLMPGQAIYAPGEQYKLVMQTDGNLVLYDDAGQALWSSKTSGNPGSHAVMLTNGQLAVYNAAGHGIFSTPTSTHPGATAAVQTDGNLVIYAGGTAVWDTGTNAKRALGPLLYPKPAFQACPPPPPPPPPPPTTTTPPPTAPVVSVPVTSPSPKRLRIKMILSWTWNHGTTRLHRIQIPHMPRRATLTVSCRGRGCARHAHHSDYRHLRRLIRWLDGHRFRSGQRVTLVVSEKGYRPERVEASIRNGRLPRVRLLT
ncbi:MAG TPA: hypothetical protein VFN55_16765 [Solirubrobacteraceae bacterium]|nr:hypothetical protein [Solirubrobacteraceae bacterium]